MRRPGEGRAPAAHPRGHRLARPLISSDVKRRPRRPRAARTGLRGALAPILWKRDRGFAVLDRRAIESCGQSTTPACEGDRRGEHRRLRRPGRGCRVAARCVADRSEVLLDITAIIACSTTPEGGGRSALDTSPRGESLRRGSTASPVTSGGPGSVAPRASRACRRRGTRPPEDGRQRSGVRAP